MFFTVDEKLAKELYKKDRIPAIRFLRERFDAIGIYPDLRTCRDIVDNIQKQNVERRACDPKFVIVRL